MTKLTNVPLAHTPGQSGAALGLRSAAKDSGVIEFGNFEIETVAGSSTLVIRQCSGVTAGYEELVDAAQIGLDLQRSLPDAEYSS